jgi:hypothetical protein
MNMLIACRALAGIGGGGMATYVSFVDTERVILGLAFLQAG